MEPLRDVDSLAHFTENPRKIIDQLETSGRPLVLTVDGEAQLVVQTAESYRRMWELLDRAQAIEGTRIGLESMERGEGRPAGEVFEELRQKHRIPRDA
jgi:PHD/YefM family antitoxin component YafN of YafNO toxin-antitoxin module